MPRPKEYCPLCEKPVHHTSPCGCSEKALAVLTERNAFLDALIRVGEDIPEAREWVLTELAEGNVARVAMAAVLTQAETEGEG